MRGRLLLKPQEVKGNYNFSPRHRLVRPCVVTATAGFKYKFGDEARELIVRACEMVHKEYPACADYLQVFDYQLPDGTKLPFWIIVDDATEDTPEITTFLLPEDY